MLVSVLVFRVEALDDLVVALLESEGDFFAGDLSEVGGLHGGEADDGEH